MEISSSPLKGCEVNCGPGRKYWQPVIPPGLIMQADCQELGSAPEPYARQSSMGYLYLLIADDGQMSEEHISVGANDRTHSDTHVVIN